MKNPDCIDYALGELHGMRRDEFERALASSPALQQELHETIALMDSLREVTTSTDSLAPEQRERLISQCHKNVASRKLVSKVIRFALPLSLAALAMIALVLGGLSMRHPAESTPVGEARHDAGIAHFEPVMVEASKTQSGLMKNEAAAPGDRTAGQSLTSLAISTEPPSIASTSEDCQPFDPEFTSSPLRVGRSSPKHTRRTADNPFIATSKTPQTYLPMSATKNSYALVRSEIHAGRLPDPKSIRIDEMVNAFRYSMESAQACGPVAIDLEAGKAPWNPSHMLLKVGIDVRNPSEDISLLLKTFSISLKFNPALVSEYRLIGYENQGGSGQILKSLHNPELPFTLTAIYEIVPSRAWNQAAADEEMCSLTVHHKFPSDTECRHNSIAFLANAIKADGKNSTDFKFAAAVAAFGMKLANTPESNALKGNALHQLAANNLGADPDRQRADFLDLIKRAARLAAA